MSGSIAEEKAALRRRLRAELKNLSATERAAASAQICQHLRAQTLWRDARSVLVYFPTAQEPDVWPLVLEALALGQTVCLPRFVAAQSQYEACRIQHPATDLVPGQFGLPEPSAACGRFTANHLDFALVPGLGFSFVGGRLGRGKGFYDRLLAGVAGLKCGVAFEFQSGIEVPLEPHDICLDCIVTPTRWHSFTRPARA